MIVLVQDFAGGVRQHDAGRDGDEIAGGLAGLGVVGERRVDLGEDRAVQNGIGGAGMVALRDAVFGTAGELLHDRLGEDNFRAIVFDFCLEDGDVDGCDAGRQMTRAADGVVAAAGDKQEEERSERGSGTHNEQESILIVRVPLGAIVFLQLWRTA